MSDSLLLIEEPAPFVRRVLLNRPEKRNAISTPLRSELFATLQRFDHDDDVRVTIVAGNGPCFSSGYDLGGGSLMADTPYHTAPGDGSWSRQVTDGWFSMWDLAKPVLAQVHGYAMAGATELMSACDLVYVAADARIGYPVVRAASPPDWPYHVALLGMRRAMEVMLVADDLSGDEAVAFGLANKAFAADELAERVLAIASRIAQTAPDLAAINKRMVHRQAEVLGVRSAIKTGQEFQALAGHQASVAEFKKDPLGAMKRLMAPPAAG